MIDLHSKRLILGNKSPAFSGINSKKKDSLIDYLYKQYQKKYNIKGNNEMVKNEIVKYASKINSSSDVINLDKAIESLIKGRKTQSLDNNSKNKIIMNNIITSPENQKLIISVDKGNVQSRERRVETRNSKMSGASDLSHYAASESRLKDKNDKMNLVDNILNKKVEKKEEVLDIHGNEWGLVAEYNKLLSEQDKLKRANKSIETKRKIKNELENQMHYKKMMKHKEIEENNKYDNIILNRVSEFITQEKEKKLENSKRSKELKITRDKLLDEDIKRKALYKYKENEKENEIGNINFNLVQLAKQRELEAIEKRDKKKQYEINLFKNVTEENKLIKELKKEIEKKEKLMDEKIEKESQLIYERMEKEHKLIKDKSQPVIDKKSNVVNTIINQKTSELIESEEKNKLKKNYYLEKDNQDIIQKSKAEIERKRILSEEYERQIKFRNEMKKNEEIQDKEYSKIWKQDYEKYLKESKTNNIKHLNEMKQNNEYLKKQIEIKKQHKSNDMSEHEFTINKEILSNVLKAKNNNSNFNF